MVDSIIPSSTVTTNEGFSKDFNSGLASPRYDPISNVVGTLAGGAVASVADFGASVWNSLPGTTNVETGDLLKNISNDALEVYNAHPDAVHAASFIGGIFVPAGIAMKGMGLARAGAKGAGWFSEAGKVADTAKVAELFKTAGAESTLYKTAVRNLYARGVANQAIDAVAAETAIVLSMNAHPLMEDYMKDPEKNFIFGALTGSALGAGIGAIADRFLIKELTGKASTEMLSKIQENTRFISKDMTNVLAFQAESQTAQNMQNLIDIAKSKGQDLTNSAEVRLADMSLVNSKLRMNEIFEEIASPEMRNLPAADRQFHMERMAEMPELYGVEKVTFLTEKEAIARMPLTLKGTSTTARPVLATTTLNAEGEAFTKSQRIVYYPDIDQYAVMGSQVHYGNAASLVDTLEQAERRLPKGSHKVANHDSAFDLLGKSSADIQVETVGKLKAFSSESMNAKEFAKAVVSESDLNSLTAARHRLLIDPEMAGKTVRIDDKSSFYQTVLDSKLLTTGPAPQKQAEAIAKLVNKNALGQKDGINFLTHSKSDSTTVQMVDNWVAGKQAPLQKGAAAYFAKGFSRNGLSAEQLAAKGHFANFYESAASVQARASLLQVADAEGYIHLYRGTSTNKLRGQAPLESMTQNFEKAKEFAKGLGGTINLYKVHVDDIAGIVEDIGSKLTDHTEFIVASTAREAQVSMDNAGKIKFAAQQASSIKPPSGVRDVGIDELTQLEVSTRAQNIDSLVVNGIPTSSIALKTNTPIGIVEAYIANASSGADAFKEVLAQTTSRNVDKATGAAISTLEQASASLTTAHKPLVLSGNTRKNPYIEAHASLDSKAMSQINNMFTMMTLAGSKSTAAREWGTIMESSARELDFMVAALGKVNNEVSGNLFLTSLDQAMRKMGDVGPIVSKINKEVTSLSQRAMSRVVEPIQKAMNPISKDPAALIEFHTFFNLNHSLGGWRSFDYETGQLMQKVMKEQLDPVTGGKTMVEILEAVKWWDKEYKVVTPSVKDLIREMEKNSPELRDMANVSKKIMGTRNVNDIGLWMPTMNPRNKFISYVQDARDGSTSMLWAHNEAQMADKVLQYRKYIATLGEDAKHVQVIEKGPGQELWTQLNGRMDSMQMKIADAGMAKSGSSAQAVVGADLSIFGEVVGGYEHAINSYVRNMVDVSIPEITGALDRMSALNTFSTKNQPFGAIKAIIKAPKDTAALVKNAMLGISNAGEYGGWKLANQTFETAISMGTTAVSQVFDAAIKPLTGKAGLNTDAMIKADYEKIAKTLSDRGVVNPWAQFDAEAAKMYSLSKIEDHPDISKRLVYAGSSLAATVILRMGDIAQPLVNMISLPILTHLAAAQKMPAEFLGVKLATTKGVSAPQIMYEGIRAMNSPTWAALGKKWEDAGYFSPMVSEINKTLQMTRALDKGAIAATERAVDSTFVKILAKPADLSEALVRKATMFNGAVLAKRLYPELDDAGITLFARDFMDKAVGNFNAGQRPVMFQGTLGVALGLFQTYSLTLAQNVYRHLEMKNYKAIGQAAMLQTGIFGSGSLPGFNAVSQAIGSNFSDDHTDLVTGSYRALGDPLASSLIYGLPSQLGVGTSTRGDSNPRFPGTGNDSLAVINFAAQAAKSVQTMADAVGNRDKSIPAAFAEALSLQSLSRPLARGAELVTGYSVTGKGNTVQTPEEVWTFAGVAARIISTRPAEEIKLRDAIHLRSFYGAVDSKNRSELMNEVKQRVRAGTLNEGDVSGASEAYFRKGGTPTGWRSAINSAMASENTDGKEIFIDKLKPNSPLNYMINSLDGYSN